MHKGLMNHYKSITVVAYTLSSVDTNTIRPADLNSIVSNKIFRNKDGEQIKDDIELLEVQSIYAKKLAAANEIEYKHHSEEHEEHGEHE